MKDRKSPRNTKEGGIWFDRYPPDHARHAFEQGFYVEALQVLHGWLEGRLQEWLLLSRHNNIRGSFKEIWTSAFDIPFLQVAKALFVTGKMPKKTFDAVCSFNSMRNKIIHRIFHESYNTGLTPISFEDYKRVLDTGFKLAEKIELNLAKLATRGKVGKPQGKADST